MKKHIVTIAAIALATAVTAEPGGARDAFLKQQAFNEMQRVSGQVDVVQANLDEVAARVSRIESSRGEIESLKAEIAALKATNAELRNRMNAMRDEIVADLTKKLSLIQKQMTPPPAPAAPQPRQPVAAGPHREYTVQGGDTLSVIAEAFKTSVGKIKEMNHLKGDNIRVGQKLILPM